VSTGIFPTLVLKAKKKEQTRKKDDEGRRGTPRGTQPPCSLNKSSREAGMFGIKRLFFRRANAEGGGTKLEEGREVTKSIMKN